MSHPLKIAVVGGGPAGLLFAKLVARENPGYRIDVFEQNPSSATYGFGIVLADVALDFLEYRRSRAALRSRRHLPRSKIPSRSIIAAPPCRFAVTCFSASRACGYSISCRRMRPARASTSSIQSGSTRSTIFPATISSSAPTASTVSCATPCSTNFQATVEPRLNKWAWYGTRHRFDSVELIFEQTPFGIFIAHSYRYAPDHGTFVIECHPDTWKRAGLDTKSDDESRRFCGDIFAGLPGRRRAHLQPLALVQSELRHFKALVFRQGGVDR